MTIGGLPLPGFAQGPENTLVVVNAESPASLAVANHYVQLRDIPPSNVVYLNNVPRRKSSAQSTDTKLFYEKILKPILNTIKKRGIENQIECIAYSASFPTRIQIKSQIQTHLTQTGKTSNKMLHTPWASITSLTYFHRNGFGERPDFFNLDSNNFANPRGMKLLTNPFSGKDASLFNAAIIAMQQGNFDSARQRLTPLAQTHPNQLSVIYALARCHAILGEDKKALASLTRAKEIGFASKSLLTSDPVFKNLANSDSFRKLTESMEDLADGVSPSRSFSASKFWAKNGWANGNDQQGERYVLSSVLAVIGNKASTLNESLTRLRSSAAVDGTAPAGSVYLADHSNVRSRTRKSQFAAAKKELETLGRRATIDSDPLPKRHPRIVGATLGSAKPDWPQSGSRFTAGAICDNLTSFGGVWGTAQTQLSEFLDAGAAGASGTVCEPFAIAAKFPSARWHAHYARGCNLAESFFQSVSGPSQLLLVGDPLCCPFGKFPDFKITGIQDGDTIIDDFVLNVAPILNSPAVAHYELFYDGVYLTKIANANQIAIKTDAIPDGYHELRIAGVSNSPTAKRHSEKFGFVLQRQGYSVDLDFANSEISLGKPLQGRVVASFGNQVQIQQNGRTISKVENGKNFIIRTGKLGLGKTKLQAVVTLPNGQSIKSRPISVSIVSNGVVPKRKKVALPSKSELNKTLASIRELLKDKYQNASAEGRDNLLKLLRKAADESTSDPVKHFALLSECYYTAALFGDVDTGWSACDQIDAAYQSEQLPHLNFIKQIETKLDEKSVSELYSNVFKLSIQMIDSDRYEDARSLANSIGSTVKQHLPNVTKEIDELIDRIELLTQKFKLIQEDLNTLTKDPSHPAANGKVGDFYCVQKKNFEQGLPHLAKGPVGLLQKLAADELSLKRRTPKQRLEIADRWWDLSQDKESSAFRQLALKQYLDILGDLKGLPKIKVKQRIQDAKAKAPNL